MRYHLFQVIDDMKTESNSSGQILSVCSQNKANVMSDKCSYLSVEGTPAPVINVSLPSDTLSCHIM